MGWLDNSGYDDATKYLVDVCVLNLWWSSIT